MNFNNGQGRGGQFIAIVTNDATVQEMAIETAGLSAESETSGVRINLVPKDGGNTLPRAASSAPTPTTTCRATTSATA